MSIEDYSLESALGRLNSRLYCKWLEKSRARNSSQPIRYSVRILHEYANRVGFPKL